MSAADLAALGPAQRTELIYRFARSGVEQRLWQAALGRIEEPAAASAAGAPGLLSLDALVKALAADEVAAPTLSPGPAPVAPGGPLRLGANEPFRPLLEAAGARSGIDPAALAAIVDAEAARAPDGRWDPGSRNPRSSAAGLGQFLRGTWLGEAVRPGSWLQQTAQARGWLDARGQVRSEARDPLLALRFDPAASIHAIADHAAANLRALRARGIAPADAPGTARAAYLAHHLGLGDALRFLGHGLGEGRAARLLAAQIGHAAADRRIAAAGTARDAHRDWLTAYVDRRIRPERFAVA